MKTILISSAVSLAIGFTFGWLIKSSASEIDGNIPDPGMSVAGGAAKPPTLEPVPPREKPDRTTSTANPSQAMPEGTAAVPDSSKQADRAKWMRLIEVLGLDDKQAKALEAALAEGRPKPDAETPPDIAYARAGAQLEKNILAILNEDQRAAFSALQSRAMGNRIEASAQETYARELADLDLTPEQREQALELLRKRAEATANEIPQATRLFLAGSFLPIGDEPFSENSIRLLQQLSPQETGDVALDKLAEKSRAEAEAKAALFESVLTPAQLELYRSRLSASSDILDQIRSGR